MKNNYADCGKWVQLEWVQKFSLIEQTDFFHLLTTLVMETDNKSTKLYTLFQSERTTALATFSPPYYDSKFCAIAILCSELVAFPRACQYRKLVIKFLFLLLRFLAGFKKLNLLVQQMC